jgi:hypothetical protein
MTLPTDGLTAVFCDWLDVTTPPDREHALLSSLGPLICAAGGSKLSDDLYDLGGGKIKMGIMRRVFRVSVSGTAIRALELQGMWSGLLAELGDGPHRVTRLDAAADIDVDGARSIALLQAAYPLGYVALSQRRIKVTELLSTRSDGQKTGTWYAGHRSGAEVTCRVYDKAQQVQDTRGDTIPPRTRAELTVRKGCTLRDAFQPERVFWHYMAPAIFDRPSGAPEWSSGWAEGWTMEKIDILPAQRLKGLIELSPELAAIIELADSVGTGGRSMAIRLIEQRVRHAPSLSSPPSSLRGTGTGGS